VVDIPEPSSELAYAIFSASRDYVALSRADHLRVWRLSDGQPASPPIKTAINYGFAHYANFSPDATRVLVGSNQGRARIWSVDTGDEEINFGAQPTRILIATMSPDGRWVVGGSRFGDVQVWDAATGKPVTSESKHRGFNGQGVFSPDGRWLAGYANEPTLEFYDLTANAAVTRSVEADGALRSGSFSSDSRRYVSGTIEGTAQVWDVQSGIPIMESLRHGAVRVTAVGFSPDGKYLRTQSSPDGKVRFWSVPPELGNEPIPEWLIELAEESGGKSSTPDGASQSRPSGMAMTEQLRATVAALAADAPFAQWGRWFVAKPDTRSLAPGFSLTSGDAQLLARADGNGDLENE
jgi:WD40 repeat protein